MFAITGTPGVGKTTVAKILKDRGYRVIDFIEIAGHYDCVEEGDDIYQVNMYTLKKLFKSEDFDFDFVDGHLSHFLADKCVVLRCRPDILEMRMKKKRWDEEKILENLEAEIIDYVLVEAMESCDEVHEIDTTHMNPEKVADAVEDTYRGRRSFPAGNVDWISILGDEIYRYLRY